MDNLKFYWCPDCDNNQFFYLAVYGDGATHCSKCNAKAEEYTSLPSPKQAVVIAERIIADHQRGIVG